MIRRLQLLLLVVAGGAIGSLARWGVAAVVESFGRSVGTYLMIVNVVGSLLLGWFIGWSAATPRSRRLAAFVAVGVLGSFTTFAGLTVEAVDLARGGRSAEAFILVVSSVAAGMAAATLGRSVARR